MNRSTTLFCLAMLGPLAPAQVAFTEYDGPDRTGFESNFALIEMATGPDGNLWFTEGYKFGSQTSIGRMTPNGHIDLFPIPSGDSEGKIVRGPDDCLWFPEYRTARIAKVTTTGDFTEYVATKGHHYGSITVGADGQLWAAQFVGAGICALSTSGDFTFYNPPPSGEISDITTGSDGNVWFTEHFANKFGRITVGGELTEFNIPTENSYPFGIASGGDGNLWFTEALGRKIARADLNGNVTESPVPSGDEPDRIAADSSGNLWFSEYEGQYVGHVTTAGVVTEIPISTPGRCYGITLGPDNNIWLCNLETNKIIRVNLHPVLPDTVTVKLGQHTSGTVGSLASEDGDAYGVCNFIVPNSVVPPVNVEVEGQAPGTTVSSLCFSTISRVSTSGGFQEGLEVWDWQAGTWDPIDRTFQPIATQRQFAQVIGTGALGRYLSPQGRLRARYTVKTVGPVAVSTWCHVVDQAAWSYTP